jgi:hypothetical protein
MLRNHCSVVHFPGRRIVLAFALSSWAAGLATLGAEAPEWWGVWRAIGPAAASDYAALNHGQLKTLARAAMQEFDGRLSVGVGAGPDVHAMVNAWLVAGSDAGGRDYAAVNIGQLKTVALPYYQRLGLTPPWTSAPFPASDYAMANIGQAKSLFAFDFSIDQDGDRIPDLSEIAEGTNPLSAADSDGSGLPDDWEQFHYGAFGVDRAAPAARGGGMSIGQAYDAGVSPNDPHDGRPPPDAPYISARRVSDQVYNYAYTDFTSTENPSRYLRQHVIAEEGFADTVPTIPHLYKATIELQMEVAPLTNVVTHSNGIVTLDESFSGDGIYKTRTAQLGQSTDYYTGWVGTHQVTRFVGTASEYQAEPSAIFGIPRNPSWQFIPIANATTLAGTYFGFNRYVTGAVNLSELYPTSRFVSEVMASLALPTDENDIPDWGEIFAWRWLAQGGGYFDAGMAVYRLEVPKLSLPHKVTWLEVFEPEDDPDTPGIDESRPMEVTKREWRNAGSTLTSPEYHFDPRQKTRNGDWFLLNVTFNKMWETKNKANQIFNPTKKDDPIETPSPAPDAAGSVHGVDSNHLFVVVDPSDDKLGVTIDVTVGGDPAKWIAAAFNGASKVSGSDTVFPPSGPVDMHIPHGDQLAIRVGFDANSNSLLDSSEEIKFAMPAKFDKSVSGEPTVKGISSTKYSAMSTAASAVIALGYAIPHSAEFLRLFRDGATTGMPPNKRPTSTTGFTIDAFNGELSEWITHNSGAAFSDGGIAGIPFRHWDATTTAAEMAGQSYTVQTAVRSHFDTTIMPLVTAHFASLPPGDQADFPQGGLATITHTHESTPAWVPRTTVRFDSPYLPNFGGDDAFGVIGRGRVPLHQAKYTVKKVEYDQYVGDDGNGGPIFRKAIGYNVIARTVGSVGDLYDFNINAGFVSEIGATLQLGYGKGTYGRTPGQIYRWDINWDETFDWFRQ